MTENEAIKRLQTLNIILTNKAGHEEDGIEKIFTFSDITAICTAIQALEEIQQYRAIGTVRGYERAIETSKENYNLYREYKDLLREYEAIGTIEEFKALKEKNVAKKPRFYAHNYHCSVCENLVGNNEFEWQRFLYCDNCGQKLDWSE